MCKSIKLDTMPNTKWICELSMLIFMLANSENFIFGVIYHTYQPLNISLTMVLDQDLSDW